MLAEHMGIGVVPTGCDAGYGHSGAFFTYTASALASYDGKTAAVLLVNARGPNADARVGEGVGEIFCAAADG